MPRIRKKTSNRVKSRDREKVKKKVRDSRKKKAKLAKKNPQWKSKKPKDPGIPNDFPYKDQILAEVQEQRRIAAEEKRRVKEEKQKTLARARALARGEIVDDESEGSQNRMDEDDSQRGPEEDDHKVDGDGIASLSAKTIRPELKFRGSSSIGVEEDGEEAEDAEPVLVNSDLPNLVSVLQKADVVIEMLDARDPLAYRSRHIEEFAKQNGKDLLLVVNKIDRCPREAVAAWAEHLRAEQPTLLFRSASSFLPPEGQSSSQPSPQVKKVSSATKAKGLVDDAVGVDTILSYLREKAKQKSDDEDFTVAVVGLVNVGKSSLINSILKKSALPVYALPSSFEGPTTTELPQEASLDVDGKTITFLDTPGFSFLPGEDESSLQELRAQDILLRSKGRIDRLKDPSPPISHIISRANKEDLMLLYSLPAFATGDSNAFLSGVARTNQLVKRKGDLDLTGAARLVLRDWNIGKFARYTAPAPRVKEPSGKQPEPTDASSFLIPLYAKDGPILSALTTRKEMRKHGGLVKLSAGIVEERKVAIEGYWSLLEDEEDQSDDDSSGDDEEENVDSDDMEGEDSDDSEITGMSANANEGDEGEDEPSLVIPLSRKQKRKRMEASSTLPRPAKRVSLGPVGSSKASTSNVVQQKNYPKGKVPPAVPKMAVPKSILRSSAGPSAKSTKEKIMKVVKPSRSTVTGGKQTVNEPETYDFGKFF